jgi:hypothetical protein
MIIENAEFLRFFMSKHFEHWVILRDKKMKGQDHVRGDHGALGRRHEMPASDPRMPMSTVRVPLASSVSLLSRLAYLGKDLRGNSGLRGRKGGSQSTRISAEPGSSTIF